MLSDLNQVHPDQMPARRSPRNSSPGSIPATPEAPPPVTRRRSHASKLSRWFGDKLRHRYGCEPSAFDLPFARVVLDKVQWLYGPGRYFDTSIRGLEHVPDGPVMMVCNHSGGTIAPDVWGLGTEWYRRFTLARPLYFLCHELMFVLPPFARAFERIGALRANHEVAKKILQAGHSLVVYPGAVEDVWRPYSKRYEIDFQGRSGFAKVAREAGVPMVPVAHAGSHEGLRVLTSGASFARAIGMYKIARAAIWPVSLMLPWGLAIGPLPHFPPPGRYRYVVGKPISPDAAETPEDVAELVEAGVQRNLDELKAEDTVH